ncbi:helix-turn-helix domain-containing protein, partial [Streptomyces sp. NRRL F-3218]|uniref:helix-turn-helix domain-containing protein n=1 Tax=Streptomyces sp. NRRL F-3218 TaxID=1463847 RepID=UPI000517A038
SHTTPTRVTARVDQDEDQEQPPAAPKPPAGPVKDWDRPGLPDQVRPGIDPIMLTDDQARARIRYGHTQGWSQRRVATFAGRSPSTVHKHIKALDAE